MPALKSKPITRLLEKVNITGLHGCWEWNGYKTAKGYGAFKINKKMITVHRFSYRYFKGSIPKGSLVCHHCDNRVCVNPYHLFIGSNADNIQDCVRKGRHSRGEKHGRSKLTELQVKEIRRLLALGESGVEISKQFNITRSQVSNIKNNRQWNHIEEVLP